MEQPNQTIASDATIAEIKGWKTSRKHTGLNEEILEALQKQLDYHGDQIGELHDRLYDFHFHLDEEIFIPIEEKGSPEEREKLRKEIDKQSRACALVRIKLLAYKNGVCLSDKDAQKLLLSGAGERLLHRNDDEVCISSYRWQREDISDSDIEANRLLLKKLKEKINRNKKKWKVTMLPYISAPLARSQPVVSTAGQRTRAKKPAGDGTRSSVESGDGNSSDDPEPPRPHLSSPFYRIYKDLPLALPAENFAEQLGCATKTIRNQVSAGLLPRPFRTAVGPRFTHEQLAQALAPQRKPARGRGRPRIADLVAVAGGVQ